MRLAGWHKKKFEEHLDRALALANKKMGIISFGTGLRKKRTNLDSKNKITKNGN